MPRQKNEFTTSEERIIREHYPTLMPMSELLELLPRHTANSIECYARTKLLIQRPKVGWSRPSPTWDAMRELLTNEPLTLQQVADRLGISKARVQQIQKQRRGDLYIADWIPPEGLGNWTMVWAYGKQKDAPFPSNAPECKKSTLPKAVNPFAAAAGFVVVPTGARGRVYQQDMTGGRLDDEEMAA